MRRVGEIGNKGKAAGKVDVNNSISSTTYNEKSDDLVQLNPDPPRIGRVVAYQWLDGLQGQAPLLR